MFANEKCMKNKYYSTILDKLTSVKCGTFQNFIVKTSYYQISLSIFPYPHAIYPLLYFGIHGSAFWYIL